MQAAITAMADAKINVETNALNLRWAFGISGHGTTHSLATAKRDHVFYVSSHTAVIHDPHTDTQLLLQGHCNPITAVCVTRDKRWLATADSVSDDEIPSESNPNPRQSTAGGGAGGAGECMIIVWDTQKATPVKIVNQPYTYGIVAMDMSMDSVFLVTLSKDRPQQIAIWEWTEPNKKEPTVVATIGLHEMQYCVRFNPVDARDIVSNGATGAIFWNWTDTTLAAYHPTKPLKKLSKAVGRLTQSIFIPYSTKAVSATDTGHVVLWDYPVAQLNSTYSNSNSASAAAAAATASGRDAIKVLKVSQTGGINLLDSIMDKYVVCGCADGAVRFYDFQFRVVGWFEDIQSGQITSLSFAENPPNLPVAATQSLAMDTFSCPDFIVSTGYGKIVRLQSKSMDHIQKKTRQGTTLVEGFDGNVLAMDCHPHAPLFAAGTDFGTLQIWNLDHRQCIAKRTFRFPPPPQKTQTHTDAALALSLLTSPVLVTKKKTNPNEIIEGMDEREQQAAERAHRDAQAAAAAALLTADQKHANAPPSEVKVGPDGKPLLNTEGTDASNAASVAAAAAAAAERNIGRCVIKCVKFSPNGEICVIGFTNGIVKIVSTLMNEQGKFKDGLSDIQAFKHSLGAITQIVFAPNGLYFATADTDLCVGLYRWYHHDEETDKPLRWIFVGKYRAHYKPIVGIEFDVGLKDAPPEPTAAAAAAKTGYSLAQSAVVEGTDGKRTVVPSSGADLKHSPGSESIAPAPAPIKAPSTSDFVFRLFSVGEDRVIQEYDVASSSIRQGLKLKYSTRIDQSATPTAFVSISGRRRHERLLALQRQQIEQAAAVAAAAQAERDRLEKDGAADEDTKEESAPAAAAADGKTPDAAVKKRGGKSPQKKSDAEAAAAAAASGGDSEYVYSDDVIVTANDEYKLKVWDVTLGKEKSCRKTLLAPTYGGPINRLFVLPKRDARSGKLLNSRYVVYSTYEKIVGLIKLPLDGNPNKAMALIAHPGPIACICSSYDGRYLLTSGAGDQAVNLWAVSVHALEASIALGSGGTTAGAGAGAGAAVAASSGGGIDAYLNLIDGGRDGPFYQDMLDYFYYAQLRSQGIESTRPRAISGVIPIAQVVALMRALGYYPTEQEVRDIVTEIKYHDIHKTGKLKQTVNLEEFIKLYVNYRPVFGLGKEQFDRAFSALTDEQSLRQVQELLALATHASANPAQLTPAAADELKRVLAVLLPVHGASGGADNSKQPILTRESLIEKLKTLGEPLSDDELKGSLKVLLGVDESQVRSTPSAAASTASDAKSKKSAKAAKAAAAAAAAAEEDGDGEEEAGSEAGAEKEDAMMSHIASLIPPLLTPNAFAQHVLGFEDYNAQQQQQTARNAQ